MRQGLIRPHTCRLPTSQLHYAAYLRNSTLGDSRQQAELGTRECVSIARSAYRPTAGISGERSESAAATGWAAIALHILPHRLA